MWSEAETQAGNTRKQAFLRVSDYFENCDEEQTTVVDLINKMEEYYGEDTRTRTHMKKKLQKHLGSIIIISTVDGKASVDHISSKCFKDSL